MGFLDHSTNNIIVDAVLTDIGRRALANNDGSFSIVKFALGDDEVDYSTVQKYGRTVGKERIEKNTPVYEAQTNSNIALKHKLVSLSNPLLTRLPRLSLVNVTNSTVSLSTVDRPSSDIAVEQVLGNGTLAITAELQDSSFLVSIPDRFLSIRGRTPVSVDVNSVATYRVESSPDSTSQGGARLSFTLQTKSLSSQQFTVFGDSTNKNQITRVASIVGTTSGAETQFKIVISNSATS